MQKLLLEAHHLHLSFGDQAVLQVERLHIYDGERVALIGENGAGKSTLLSILAGERMADSGTVRRFGPVALIHQWGDANGDADRQTAAQLNAPDRRAGLSGGEMTRRRIAQALSRQPALLLADEPTTDLDAGGIQRLTQLLQQYRGALLLVSHDRNLLNALCTRVLHLEDGRLTDFPGPYADYQAELQRRRDFQQFEYDQYRAERARLKAAVQQKAEWAASVQKAPKRMGNSEARLHKRAHTNAILAQSAAKRIMENRIERLERKERPRDLPNIQMALGVAHPVEAKTAITIRCDVLQAGERVLLKNTSCHVPTGSRTALMGDNGTGKTTLLRALRGDPSPGTRLLGEIRINPKVRMGCFDQDHEKTLDPHQSALANAMADSTLPESVARTVLARLNLTGDHVFKPVQVLSGGERAKVALARLLLSDINLLVLDEPTNHLDLFTLEALQPVLASYGGTLLVVSHDTAFVSAVATRILTIEKGAITTFEGTLEQQRADRTISQGTEALRLEISTLEMQLAALAGRMSAPKKGDRPDDLNARYQALMEQRNQLKAQLEPLA